MKTQENDKKSEAKELRQMAEAELLNRKLNCTIVEVDSLKLIHELQVYQIELEMQNEELVSATVLAEAAMEKYTDLYDFAPSGYVTLSEDGNITDLNFLAANLLGKDRAHLKNTRFGLYLAPASLVLFNQFLDEAFRWQKKQSCELILQSSPNTSCYIHIDASVSQGSNICLLTMIDITERKEMEIELRKSSDRFEGLNRYFMDREMRMIDLKHEINALLIKSGCEKEYLI
jgi:PAS domain-containing protein